jgi:ribosome-associated protein
MHRFVKLCAHFVDKKRMSGKIHIPENAVQFVFSRSSGPGGQNVNKVNTQATAILDIHACGLFSPEQKTLLFTKLANRIDKQGRLQVTGSRFRSQQANRQDILDRINRLIASALIKPKPRKPTRAPASAKRKRLEQKKRKSVMKKYRSTRIGPEND